MACNNLALKLKIVLANGTEWYVRDILLDGQRRKYAFHWPEGSGCLIARRDNATHWPEIETLPHHKQVVASEGTTLEEVLAVIRANM
jgi:hypothetical protein